MFIEINGRILDLEKYNEEVALVKKLLFIDSKELFEKFGFEQQNEQQRKKFYNKNLDLEINFGIKKRKQKRVV